MPSDVQRVPRVGAATDASIRELGGVSTPDDLRRDVSVDGTVILATTGTSDDAALVQQLAAEHGWPLARVDTVDAAAWAANIQKISLVIAAGDDPAFALDIVKAIRRATTAPTMSLGLSNPHDRVRTMVEGADVALPPGMAFAEFGAQVFALLRRSSETWEPAVRYLSAGHLLVDLWSRNCAVAGEPVDLTPREFELLVYLMHHPRQSLSTQKIVQKVWQNWGYASGLNTLRIHISRLRHKLGVHPEASGYIRSVRSFGYEFRHNVVQVGDAANKVASDSPGDLKLASVLLDIARHAPDPVDERGGWRHPRTARGECRLRRGRPVPATREPHVPRRRPRLLRLVPKDRRRRNADHRRLRPGRCCAAGRADPDSRASRQSVTSIRTVPRSWPTTASGRVCSCPSSLRPTPGAWGS